MFGVRPIVVAILLAAASSQVLMSPALAADAAAAPAVKVKDAKAAKAPAAASAPQDPTPQVPNLTAAQIVEKHVAARGGAQAWKTVKTMQLSGKLDAGRGDNIARARKMVNAGKKVSGKGTNAEVAAANSSDESAKQIQLPFTLDLKRPNLTRLEVQFAGKTAVQVYDGAHGWKLRPFLNRDDVEPFTADEAKTEASRGDLDGPLIDYASKGAKVERDGVEMVDGQPAYKLKVTPKNGAVQHVWVDAKTFLDVKMDGFPRRMDGKMHPVYVYQRDFRDVQGVLIPFVVEIEGDGDTETHKLLIEKAAINPALDDALFAKPHA
jgi:outer membrane lipoprotein-sorting protein